MLGLPLTVDFGEIDPFGIVWVTKPFKESVVVGVTRVGYSLDEMVMSWNVAPVLRRGRTFPLRHLERPLDVLLGLGILTPDV